MEDNHCNSPCLRILVLEDNGNRFNIFYDALGVENEICWAQTADQAIAFLSDNDFDVLFLDHDLGGMVDVDAADTNTGYERL